MRLLAEDCTPLHGLLNAMSLDSGVRTKSVKLTSRTRIDCCIGHVHTECFDYVMCLSITRSTDKGSALL